MDPKLRKVARFVTVVGAVSGSWAAAGSAALQGVVAGVDDAELERIRERLRAMEAAFEEVRQERTQDVLRRAHVDELFDDTEDLFAMLEDERSRRFWAGLLEQAAVADDAAKREALARLARAWRQQTDEERELRDRLLGIIGDLTATELRFLARLARFGDGRFGEHEGPGERERAILEWRALGLGSDVLFSAALGAFARNGLLDRDPAFAGGAGNAVLHLTSLGQVVSKALAGLDSEPQRTAESSPVT